MPKDYDSDINYEDRDDSRNLSNKIVYFVYMIDVVVAVIACGTFLCQTLWRFPLHSLLDLIIIYVKCAYDNKLYNFLKCISHDLGSAVSTLGPNPESG